MSEPTNEQDTPASFRTRYKEASARHAAARKREREKVAQMGLWEAFKYRCGVTGIGTPSFLRMMSGVGGALVYAAVCGIWLVASGGDQWQFAVGLLVCPVSAVVMLRGWSYGKGGTLLLGVLLFLLGVVGPWWIDNGA